MMAVSDFDRKPVESQEILLSKLQTVVLQLYY